jgi:hypothetical protein
VPPPAESESEEESEAEAGPPQCALGLEEEEKLCARACAACIIQIALGLVPEQLKVAYSRVLKAAYTSSFVLALAQPASQIA